MSLSGAKRGMEFNVFEGARRIVLALHGTVGLCILGWVMLSEPYLSALFTTTGPTIPFVNDDTCESGTDAVEWVTRQSEKGRNVSVRLCFRAASFPNGEKLVPYRQDSDGRWGAGRHSSAVEASTKRRAREFTLPVANRKEADGRWWGTKVENASYGGKVFYELVSEYYDAAVSGGDPVDSRPGFAAMLERIEANGVRTIIVETASRFARDLMVQEVGHAKLRERGIDLIAADNPGSFIEDTPTAQLVRQVLGAISEFDKAMTVAKLRGARERKRRETGKCEGRKSHAERNPELVELARRLHRRRPKGGQRSLREISAELAAQGHLNAHGQPYAAASIKSMLDR